MKQTQSNESGSLVLPFIIVLVFLLGSLGFGAWAFMGRMDYKNNSDKKSATAVKKAIAAEDIKKDAEHAEADKLPNTSYTGPSTYGDLFIQYPKTYNAYISERTNGKTLAEGYFSPDYVASTNSGVAYALRFQISSNPYATVLKGYEKAITSGLVTSAAYRPAKVPSALGTILTGQIAGSFRGAMVLLPLRDKTIYLWTEDEAYLDDFTNTVLANLTFVP